jgi:molecular chaperone DnaK (HSP70)
MNDCVIGLDFGNYNSFPCFIEDFDPDTKIGGTVRKLIPPQYNNGIPSVYFYSKKKGAFYGYDAMSSRATPANNRLRYLKRQLGQIVAIDDKSIAIDEAITEVIQYCVRLANEQLLENFRKTTNLISLSYPASYTCAQRQRLIELAEKATLEDGTKVKVCGTISEPAAAALDYLAMHGKTDKESTVLTYDLGGGTFDLALVTAYPKGRLNAFGDTYYYDIINHRGLDKVGGKEFDQAMFELLLEKVDDELLGDELTQRERDNLRNAIAEKTKIELSSMDISNPEIIHDDEVLDIEVTREEFEEKTKDLLMQTIEQTKQILADHPECKPEYIVLTGGSSEMPMVEEGLKRHLPEYKDKIIKFQPTMAISCGAARFGTTEKEQIDEGSGSPIQQRIMYDIGVRLLDESKNMRFIDKFVSAGTPLPYTSPYHSSYTVSDNQRTSYLPVFEAKVEKPDSYNVTNDYTEIMHVTVDHGKPIPKNTETKSRILIDKNGCITIEAYSTKNQGALSKCSVDLKNLS